MATARAVARDLRQAAGRLSAIGDDAVAAGGTAAIEAAGEIGGRWGRQTLRARVTKTTRAASRSLVQVWPVPAWAWSIRSHGRSAVRPTRKQALRFAGRGELVHARSAAPVRSGDGSIGQWQERSADEFVRAARELRDKAIQ